MKMKNLKAGVLAVAASALLALQPAQAAVLDFDKGDLSISFYTTGGTGSTTNVTVSLGDQASSFRGDLAGNSLAGSTYWTANGGGSFTFNTNIGAALEAAFGEDWYTRTDLYWGINGNLNNSGFGSTVNGDPTRTVYLSRAVGESAWAVNPDTVNGTATNLQSHYGFIDTLQADLNQTLIATYLDQPNSYESWQYLGPQGGLADWKNFNSVNANANTSLDVYRLLYSATGANPAGIAGQGQSIGRFTIGENGSLTFTAAAVPEPSTYALIIIGVAAVYFIRRRSTRTA